MKRCYFCGNAEDTLALTKYKVIGKDFDKKKQKTLNMCLCCDAHSDNEWIAEQLGWSQVTKIETKE